MLTHMCMCSHEGEIALKSWAFDSCYSCRHAMFHDIMTFSCSPSPRVPDGRDIGEASSGHFYLIRFSRFVVDVFRS